MNPEIKHEICKAFALLGVDFGYLGLIGSIDDSLTDEDVLDGLRAWNSSTTDEIKGRIEQYGTAEEKQ